MKRLVIGAGVLAVLTSGPAFAIAPECHDQLAQIKAEMGKTTESQRTNLANKYQEAERLCAENKDMEAQNLAREIREQLAQHSGTSSASDRQSNGSSK